ncbi:MULTISPECIES: ParA family protein [unclassified Nocardia]|uniref:ParA family protein n=1 Tax=unclassified Nocardia TaxID=2637762 RepID=UPI001CE42CBC|nr:MULTISPECIES: ParA family protein [unclassified Nocardia]
MSTLDVEITSSTTATATWPEGEPVQLRASDKNALWVEIHRFSTRRAAAANSSIEVTITDADRYRVVTVSPDGSATASTPSGPIAAVDRPSARPEPIPVTDPIPATTGNEAVAPPSVTAAEPVVIAAEPIAYSAAELIPDPPQHTAAPPESPPPRPVARPAPSVAPAVSRALPSLAAPQAAPAAPARQGLRGRLNAALHLGLAPKPESAEMRQRTAASVIAGPIPTFARVSVASLKGGVGKTPIAIGLSNTMAAHRGAGSVVCADFAEVGGSLADRVAAPPGKQQDVIELLNAAAEIRRRPAALSRYLTRQPTGDDILAGRQGLTGTAPLDADQAAALDAILSQQREILVADTGNNQLAGSWQWAISHADVLVVPVPLRRDAAIAAVRMLVDIAQIDPVVLTRTVVVVTDGPGDQPMVETEAVDAFVQLDVARVLRMPYEPLFAGGERILPDHLRPTTTESLTVIAATVVELMTTAAR